MPFRFAPLALLSSLLVGSLSVPLSFLHLTLLEIFYRYYSDVLEDRVRYPLIYVASNLGNMAFFMGCINMVAFVFTNLRHTDQNDRHRRIWDGVSLFIPLTFYAAHTWVSYKRGDTWELTVYAAQAVLMIIVSVIIWNSKAAILKKFDAATRKNTLKKSLPWAWP